MKSKTYYYLSEMSNVIMIYSLVMAIVVFALMMVGSKVDVWLFSSVFVLITGVYFVRTKCNNILLYILGYFVLSAVTIVIALQSKQYGLVIVLVGTFLFINMWWYATKLYYGLANFSVYVVSIFAIFFVAADIKGFATEMNIFFTFGMIFFFMNYMRMFCSNVNIFSREKAKNEKMPYDEMIKNDSRIAIPFIVVSLLIMIALKVDFLDNWFVKIYMKMIVYVRNALFYIIELIETIFNKLFPQVPVQRMTFEFDSSNGQTSAFGNIFSAIIVILIFAFACFIFIRIIVSIIKNFEKKEFMSEQNIEEKDMIEIRERIYRTKVKKEKLSPIRRQYKQKVEKLAKKGYSINRSHTPSERVENVKKEMKEDIHELSSIYSKERYSNIK